MPITQEKPDVNVAAQCVSLRHLRPSRFGFRLLPSTKTTSWRSRKPSVTIENPKISTAPLFLGKDTHALSEPAIQKALLEVLAANDVAVMIDADDGYTPTPVISARDPRAQ